MQGSPTVIAALNEVFHNLLAVEQQAHLQEHLFEAKSYGFAKWFHVIEETGHAKMIHPLLNRIFLLGGIPNSVYAFTPGTPTLEVIEAMTSILECLGRVHTAYGVACDAAEDDDDYVTEKMIWKSLKWLEERMSKFESRIAQYNALGKVAFIAEFI